MARHTILEAYCTECGEIFNPDNEQDLIHGMKNEGSDPCGGRGELRGAWTAPSKVARGRGW